jgi:hypothetical protein
LNSKRANHRQKQLDEICLFIYDRQSGTVADVINLSLNLGEWNFPESVAPPGKPKAEYELDLKISYDDSKMWGNSGLSVNPYADLWWSIAGSSNVVLGRMSGTGYFEFGIVPTYTIKGIPDYPIRSRCPCTSRPVRGATGAVARVSRRKTSAWLSSG